jgi:hypothetical protein
MHQKHPPAKVAFSSRFVATAAPLGKAISGKISMDPKIILVSMSMSSLFPMNIFSGELLFVHQLNDTSIMITKLSRDDNILIKGKKTTKGALILRSQ